MIETPPGEYKPNFKTMTKKQIVSLKDQGYGRDSIYEFAAGNYGLFGIAFFGHKAKKGDRQKLNRVWKRIVTTFEQLQA